MPAFDPTAYAPAIAALLHSARLAPLGPGRPNATARAPLQALADDAFHPHRVVDRALADACRAGLWLYHDFVDDAHTVSQDLDTSEGSYWHALVHRREPDFSNSKYWFRRVGTHPVFEPLRVEATRLAEGASGRAAFLTRQTSWDPFAFVDLCEANYDENAPDHELCRRVQGVEWELLFDHCYRGAVGMKP